MTFAQSIGTAEGERIELNQGPLVIAEYHAKDQIPIDQSKGLKPKPAGGWKPSSSRDALEPFLEVPRNLESKDFLFTRKKKENEAIKFLFLLKIYCSK